MLKREKDQLAKEIEALDKRRLSAMKQLESITKRINTTRSETQEEQNGKNGKKVSSKPIKAISINY